MKKLFSIFILALTLYGCNKQVDTDMNQIYKKYGQEKDIASLIEEVSQMKIYFGHQSVGRNILGGIEQWEKETGKTLPRVDSRELNTVIDIPFVHFPVAANGDAKWKIDDFVTMIDSIPEGGNPVALFKFCYLDIMQDSDVEDDFKYYKEKMLYLKDTYPKIRFGLVTVPYTGVQKGSKVFIKRILGRNPYGYGENIKREQFNKQVIEEFDGVIPIFDLGEIESTRPDGSQETYKYRGEEYPCMPSYYRYDYGHLNEYGAKVVSYNFLGFLAEEF